MRLLLIIGLVFVVLWLLGFFAFHLTTPVLHALIIIGVILIIVDLFRSRRSDCTGLKKQSANPSCEWSTNGLGWRVLICLIHCQWEKAVTRRM
ncbi:MAG: DUF5670 family protein [Bacteroidales bacterium]|nr:DUF5670 family protein [Bacteroidales bacterium]